MIKMEMNAGLRFGKMSGFVGQVGLRSLDVCGFSLWYTHC